MDVNQGTEKLGNFPIITVIEWQSRDVKPY